MGRRLLILTAVLLALAGPALAADAPSTGAKQITISGGKMGDISFPHGLHQDTLKQCGPCHDIFPQKSGAIAELQSKGTLKKKAVMDACLKCHRDRKSAGQPTGPTSCSACHVKK